MRVWAARFVFGALVSACAADASDRSEVPASPAAGLDRSAVIAVSSSPSAGASSSVAPPAALVPAPLIAVSLEGQVQVDAGVARQIVRLRSGDSVRSGDWFWIDLEVFRPCHVYVVQVTAGGALELLFPLEGEADERRAADSTLRLPPAGEVFAFDEHPGTERLVVIASESPIEVSDTELSELVAGARVERSEGVEPAGPPTPPSTTPSPSNVAAPSKRPQPHSGGYLQRVADRGIKRVRASASVELTPKADGVAVMTFELVHR